MRSGAILVGAALLAACSHHEEIAAGPAGLPYLCADGRSARIHYDGGDPNRMPARLSFDGHDYRMVPDPAMSGLRYRSEEGVAPGRALVWAAQGEEAALIEAAEGGEREIVRCARVREGEAAAPAAEAH
jgi:membrane-bound inhibitor of C-type lysozyme